MWNLAPAVVAAVVVAPASSLPAGDWGVSSELNATLTQSSYSDNWAGGEAGGVSWALNSGSIAEKQLHERIHTRSTLRLSFGQTHSQDRESKRWAKPVKSTDLIDLESVLRFTLGGFVDPFAAMRVETQFVDDTEASGSTYLDPVTLSESVGIARALIEGDGREWTARLGGSLRQRLDRDVPSEEPGGQEDETTTDGGIELVTELRMPLADGRVGFVSRLRIFKALFRSESDGSPGESDRAHLSSPDVNWENTLTASVAGHVMVNLDVQLLYDREIDLRPRLKEVLSLGLTFGSV